MIRIDHAIPTTEEQQQRMDASEARIKERRRRANLVWLSVEETKADTLAVNCAKCARIGDFSSDKQVGWCGFLRRMVSTWHGVRCDAFKVAS